jgi:hypothetical protein
MNQKTRARWQTGTAVLAALIVGAVLPVASVAADDSREAPKPPPAAKGSSPAVYILDGRGVAIRRDPLPPGAYGGQGVDYSPDLAAYVLGNRCSN